MPFGYKALPVYGIAKRFICKNYRHSLLPNLFEAQVHVASSNHTIWNIWGCPVICQVSIEHVEYERVLPKFLCWHV